jgi:DNA-binding NarL/FixJ family response regulator
MSATFATPVPFAACRPPDAELPPPLRPGFAAEQEGPLKSENCRPYRVLLADDHDPTREEILRLISREADMTVVASVATGEEAVSAAQTSLPDFIVLDILLPLQNGIEVCRAVSDALPGARIVALSNHAGPLLVKAFLKAGGMGYVRKDHAFEDLIPAIRTILGGREYLGREVLH